jgi:hypothetical protein
LVALLTAFWLATTVRSVLNVSALLASIAASCGLV